MRNTTPYSYLKRSILVIAIAFLVSMTTAACGDEAAETDSDDRSDSGSTRTTVKTTTEPEPLTEDYVKEKAAYRIGKPNLVRSVTLTEQGSDTLVDIQVDRPELCHDGALYGTISTFVQQVMGVLYKKYPEVANISITVYGTTISEFQYNFDEVVMKIDVNRDSAKNIDWFEFTEYDMPVLATSFYVDPGVESSFELEGGQPFDTAQ